MTTDELVEKVHKEIMEYFVEPLNGHRGLARAVVNMVLEEVAVGSGTKFSRAMARDRGQRDRRMKLRARSECPFSNKKLKQAWTDGWDIVDRADALRALKSEQPK
jgi:ribosome modulation factor